MPLNCVMCGKICQCFCQQRLNLSDKDQPPPPPPPNPPPPTCIIYEQAQPMVCAYRKNYIKLDDKSLVIFVIFKSLDLVYICCTSVVDVRYQFDFHVPVLNTNTGTYWRYSDILPLDYSASMLCAESGKL
jgi:hypothetical protein